MALQLLTKISVAPYLFFLAVCKEYVMTGSWLAVRTAVRAVDRDLGVNYGERRFSGFYSCLRLLFMTMGMCLRYSIL